MILKKATYKAMKYSCLKFHYAKTVPINIYGYSVFNLKNEWCGCIIYGTGANNNIGKEFNLKQGQIIELVRVALNGKQESTSKALSISLRLIKKDIPLCQMIVSYADMDQTHKGIIYQATNWYYVGKKMINKPDASFVINGKRIHGKTISDRCKRMNLKKTKENICKAYKTDDVQEYITKGKIKYLYPLNEKTRNICELLKRNYSEI